MKKRKFKPGDRVHFKGYKNVKPFVGLLTGTMNIQSYWQGTDGNYYTRYIGALTFDENGKFTGFPRIRGLERVTKRKYESLMRSVGEN